ncbi:hypothetical protein W97_08543 [Coniosporium apollinis CBS 100218]|uniref:Protein BIG1 n=1 Tax=Coniosporium apollinis (strain CBS 100218) TaxID=1168221 RepID=R7Z4S7_CONA1|nr:uncharacterized protein W97_08543 [Coniosporium apollinis CBS 100218]EON69185.1 hypothetical protein W97_08543 [Coniosporium apollinis CBS 100218]
MALRRIGALALSATLASAFRDTSPFFMFSDSPLPNPVATTQLALSGQLSSQIQRSLADCPSDTYIIVSQPGISAADFSDRSSTPHLRDYVDQHGGHNGIQSSVAVAEVVGALSTDALSQRLADRCKATIITVDSEKRHINMGKATPRVIKVDFPVLPSHREERVAELGRRDSYLDAMIAAAGERFTVIYTTTPPSSEQLAATQHKSQVVYEMDESYPEAYHMDLKRDVSSHADNNTASKLPLFEKYQFLSSGIFMGLSVSLLLFMILYVAVSAVSSLEVSYYAFSKEMGPAAQKKQGQ